MATYSTNIILKDALISDYNLLATELRQASFLLSSSAIPVEKASPTDLSALFTSHGKNVLEVVKKVQYAAEKTGKLFSFTVIKNKITV